MTRNFDTPVEIGVLAETRDGAWHVCIDETVKGIDRWFFELDGPSIYFRLELPSLNTVRDLAIFLASTHDCGEYLLGHIDKIPVFVLRDDEFKDRLFLHARTCEPATTIRVTLAGDDFKSFISAVRVLADQITNKN